ncbi:type II toxin-antitoxin system RelE/ParE family toxin [Marinovum sp.]|uniref:type II toxin-antitoxin system RelE/ParE family toxin n=1 Tax=Marinovum sp. TaxID=2024839 RepID=UPI002B26DE14|nr:type II toxin-antitoxin system RelE/ParE family toxin [Marinovum sp.]
MVYEVRRAAGVARDLELIFEFLLSAAEGFGESPERAFALAEARLDEIETALDGLGRAPHQGTLRPHLGPGLRNVTKGRAVIYFDTDDSRQLLRVLAVFFGGQDHQSHILLRLLSDRP